MARYIRQEEIGRGSWGVVYKALDTFTQETVALKVLSKEAGFPKRELTLARRVTHRNVCRVYDYVEAERAIAMEYVDGGNLRDLIERSGQLPADEAPAIARQILDGIEAIHQENIIHRDLKPANILLTKNGTVKVTDFGLAKVIDSKGTSAGGPPPGTREYMSPEQAKGHECDARADIYSFGVILKELFSSATMPAYIEVAIQECTEWDPARRFSSVAEVRNALTEPIVARPVPVMTGFLVAALIVASAGSYFLWSRSWNAVRPIVQAPPAASPAVSMPAGVPVVKALPTVAVLVDGGIGQALAEGIGNEGRFQVLERTNVAKALSEIHFNDKMKPDDPTLQRAGRILGAQYLAFVVTELVEGQLHLHARLVQTESSLVVFNKSLKGRPADADRMAAELGRQFHL